jgi:hypothetical protein
MSNRKKLISFLGEKLNDKDLKNSPDIIGLNLIESNRVPKRTSISLTHLSVKNSLKNILEFETKNSKKKKGK